MARILLALISLWIMAPWVAAQSLNSLVDIQGIRENQLIGYSLVVGLNGTGDKDQVKFTTQSITNMLRQFGVQLQGRINPKVKNVAAVAVSANLPSMYAPGQTIDVTVSSIGDAKSLRGGTLLLTQLRGADGQVYALAQGNIVVGGFSAQGATGTSVTENTPTAGLVPNGATIERSVPTDFQGNNPIILNLKSPSFKTANNIAKKINQVFGPNTATAESATNIAVVAPLEPGDRVAFMSKLEDINVISARQPPKIIFNSRTGTVVIGEGVILHPAAVSQGNLTVNIKENLNVSQPNPLARGNTVVTPQSRVNVSQGQGHLVQLPAGSNLKDLVDVLNGLGASPDDMMSILQALHQAGALDADLEVI